MPEAWSASQRPLDTEAIIAALGAQRVRFVVIGGIAAVLHGWSGATADFDIVPEETTRNLNALGRALRALGAVPYADPARADLASSGKPPEADDFGYTAEGLLRHRVWHLTSAAGSIDIRFSAEGVGGYAEHRPGAGSREVFGISVSVASLDDIITSKRAVARAKDLRMLPELYELRDQRPS